MTLSLSPAEDNLEASRRVAFARLRASPNVEFVRLICRANLPAEGVVLWASAWSRLGVQP